MPPNASVRRRPSPRSCRDRRRRYDEQGALTEISRNRSTRFLIEFGDDDAGPLGVQRPGIRLADAAPGPGDDGDAVGETLGHQASSMVVVR